MSLTSVNLWTGALSLTQWPKGHTAWNIIHYSPLYSRYEERVLHSILCIRMKGFFYFLRCVDVGLHSVFVFIRPAQGSAACPCGCRGETDGREVASGQKETRE